MGGGDRPALRRPPVPGEDGVAWSVYGGAGKGMVVAGFRCPSHFSSLAAAPGGAVALREEPPPPRGRPGGPSLLLRADGQAGGLTGALPRPVHDA
jgi:hypothetical protein